MEHRMTKTHRAQTKFKISIHTSKVINSKNSYTKLYELYKRSNDKSTNSYFGKKMFYLKLSHLFIMIQTL